LNDYGRILTFRIVKSDSQLERPLPHSAEAERAVLASILLDGPGIQEAILQLEPNDFFLPAHRAIYQHIRVVVGQGRPPDTVVVLDSLMTSGELELAGGVGYLSQIPDGIPRISNLRFYVDMLKQKTRLRQRAYTAQRILELALGANSNAGETLREIANLSTQLREEVGQNRILKFRSGAEIAMATNEQLEWLVPGFVAKGALTELGGKVKTGKTTLIMSLVRALADGSSFLGLTTLKTPTVYLTEQPTVSFRHALQRANLLGREDFRGLSHSDIRETPWPVVAAGAIDECKRVGAVLLVIDTLPQFAGLKGDSENNSGDALAAMQPLQKAAAEGIGIILIRHERKSGGDVGDSGRGSSAFAGAVDIVLSLRRPEGNSKKTLRVLQALSRFSEPPPELLIELTDSGYISLGEPHEAAVKEAKTSILAIIPKSESEALGLKELMESAEVPRATAQRAVKELAEERALSRVGEGKRGSPFRYYLPENRFSPTSDIEGKKESLNEADTEQPN
jgi:hypothetical protein